MAEISTRVWLDEDLWETMQRRAVAEGATVRELIPRLLGYVLADLAPAGQAMTVTPRAGPTQECTPAAGGPSGVPVVPLAEAYGCGICGEELRLSRLSAHLGKHLKELQASEG